MTIRRWGKPKNTAHPSADRSLAASEIAVHGVLDARARFQTGERPGSRATT